MLCNWDSGDCITRESPLGVFVSSSRPVPRPANDWELPYGSIFEALSELWAPFTHVNLLSGDHLVWPKTTDNTTHTLLPILGTVTISTFFCPVSGAMPAECASEEASIHFTNFDVGLTVLQELHLKDLVIRSDYSLKAGCSLESCEYCPAVSLNLATNTWMDDRKLFISRNNFAEQKLCDFFQDSSMFAVKPGSLLSLTNVVVKDVRKQHKALILNQCGELRLTNVTFLNVMARRQGLYGGVIQQVTMAEYEPYYCGSFKYDLGYVMLLNNGYEYTANTYFSGFLWLSDLYHIEINSVKFSYSYIYVGDAEQAYGSALLFFNQFRQLSIRNCTFEFSIANTGAALYIYSSLAFPLVIENGVAAEQSLQHVLIQDCLFTGNTGRVGSTIYMQFLKDHQNVLLRNNTFINNFATNRGIVDLVYAYLDPKYTTGQTIQVLQDSTTLDVFIPPISTVFDSLQFISNYAPMLSYISNAANFVLINSVFVDNGDSLIGMNYANYILRSFIDHPLTHIDLEPVLKASTTCIGTFHLEDVYNASVTYNSMQLSYCPKGSPGLDITGHSEFVMFTQVTISDFEMSDSVGFAMLYINSPLDISLQRLTFTNNSNQYNANSVCLDITPLSPQSIEITDSVFTDNVAIYATLARVSEALSLTLSNCTATGNRAISTSAGFMFTPLVFNDTSVIVTDCRFRNNSALRGGVAYIVEETGNMVIGSSHVSITLLDCEFEDNKSEYGGCALTISGFVVLSSQSVVRNNRFINNSCTEGGSGLFVSFVSGVLQVENNHFEGNKGLAGIAVYSTHKGSKDRSTWLSLQDNTFSNNQGGSIVVVEGALTPILLTKRNTFLDNSGPCVSVTAAHWTDESSSYTHCHSSDGGVFLARDQAFVSLSNFTAKRNSATIKGGVASLSTSATVICSVCLLEHNSCQGIGGAASIDQGSTFNCSLCRFISNTAGTQGSAIYSIFSSISLSGSDISNNRAYADGAIFLVQSHCSLFNSTMTQNTASSQSPGLELVMSNLTISNCSFAHQSAETGAFLVGAVSVIVRIEDSSFAFGQATFGGALYCNINCAMTVLSTKFFNCSASAGSLAQFRSSTLVFDTVQMYNLVSDTSSGALHLIESNIVLSRSSFAEIEGSAVLAESSYVQVRTSRFQQLTASSGSAINSMNCYLLEVSSCHFEQGMSKQGGAVYSYTTGFLSSSLTSLFQNNVFLYNKAINGGAIYSNSVLMTVKNNTFIGNSANRANYPDNGLLKTGIGGAIMCSCEFIDSCNFQITGNLFRDNVAETKGGAVDWFDSYPLISANEMRNNSAEYGNDLASFAIQLVPLTIDKEAISFLTNETVPLAWALEQVASGHVSSEVLTFGLIDHYGNVVSDDSSSSAQILLADSNVSVTGATQVVAEKGVFVFEGLIFTGLPESSQRVLITTGGVSVNLKLYASDPSTYIPTVAVELEFRKCQLGESYEGLQCYVCPAGTFSLDPAKPCVSCPSHVTCYGNYTMVPDPGYWRPDPTLNLVFQCPNPDACLGSPASLLKPSLIGICAEGYSGNLCCSCAKTFSREGKNICGKCPSVTSNVIVSTLVLIAALILGSFIIIIAIRGATRPRSEIAIHLKIFMNYLQMVVVAASLNINWPDFVSLFLNGQDTAGSVAEQFFSFDCIVQEITAKSVYYTKIQAQALIPAGLLVLAACVWAAISICSKVSNILHKVVASLVMILFILHPSLTKSMFSLYSCKELRPGELWLVADFDLRCWSSDHVKNILMVSVPSIGIWIFGLPIVCLLNLYRLRRGLLDPFTQLKFSFLYKGYHLKWYFWEFVILYRKVALVCAAVFLSTVSIMVQALSVLAVLLIALFFQLQVQPFNLPVFNRLELKSILVSSVTIYSGLFYQTESIGNSHIDTEVKVLLFVAILMENGYFLLGWVKCVLPLLIDVIRRRFTKAKQHYRIEPIGKEYKSSGDIESSVFSGTREQGPNISNSDISDVRPI